MTQQKFEQENTERWDETDILLRSADRSRWNAELERLPHLYRRLCADAALARHRDYGEKLCARLNDLVIRSREALTRGRGAAAAGAKTALWGAFARSVRREWRLVLLNLLLFWGPFLAMIAAASYEERWIFAVLGDEEMRQLDGMYGQDSPLEFLREEFGSDFMMFGFYIYNNVSIGLRMIAAGALAAVGAAFITAYQGVVIGAMAGYVHYAGNLERFYTFVAGHSSFELTGLILCGVAGMRLGLAFLKPGALSRGEAMREAAREALPLIYGGPLLVFLAAFIEGFWSASDYAPPPVKIAAGLGLWVLLLLYFLLAGRGREHEA